VKKRQSHSLQKNKGKYGVKVVTLLLIDVNITKNVYASRKTQKWKEIVPGCPMIGQQEDSSFTSSMLEHSAKNSIGTASEECESAGLAKKLM
jgi:hypothetical protein